MSVRIDESTINSIVISAIEIVETEQSIIIVATVAEGIDLRNGQVEVIGVRKVSIAYNITPGVVFIPNYFLAGAVAYSKNITLKILLKEEGFKLVLSHIGGAVVQADRSARFVIDINKKYVAVLLADYLRAA